MPTDCPLLLVIEFIYMLKVAFSL